MPNTIISGDFLGLGTITDRSETAPFVAENVEDYWHLKRRFRANDVTDTAYLLRFALGANKTIEAIVLDDVNFDAVRFNFGDAAGVPIETSGDLIASIDPLTDRYKIIYIPTVVPNRQHVEIYIPAGTSAVGSYTTKWEIGRAAILDSITEITKNTYSRTSIKAYEDVELRSGGRERVDLGNIGWEGTLGFDMRKEVNETSLWALNNMDVSKPLILYENDTDTSRVYICLRDDAYEGSLVYHGVASGNTIKLKELI